MSAMIPSATRESMANCSWSKSGVVKLRESEASRWQGGWRMTPEASLSQATGSDRPSCSLVSLDFDHFACLSIPLLTLPLVSEAKCEGEGEWS